MKNIFLFVLLFSHYSHAEWFEVMGISHIKQGNIAKAKLQAIEDGITQALIFSGASVNSVQSIANGVLSEDTLKIKAHGEIQAINIIDEDYKDDQYTVTLHLDIFPKTEHCPNKQFAKQVAITQSQLIRSEQALTGQIFDIAKASSERLFNTLIDRNTDLRPIPYFEKSINVKPFFSQQFDFNTHMIESLTSKANSQYVLLSQITDISIVEKSNSAYAFWQSDEYLRSFKIDFALFDALTYEQIWAEHYVAAGQWPYEKTQIIDVYSDKFWNTDFAKQIQKIFNRVSEDVNAAIACNTARGKILHRENDTLVINLGQSHGLKKGQELGIIHRNDLVDAHNTHYSNNINVIDTVTVIQVNKQSAIVKNNNPRPLNNIQINDLVEIQVNIVDEFKL